MVKSILDGTDDLIDRWLGLDRNGEGEEPRYKHIGNLGRLSKESQRLKNLSGKILVTDLLSQITDNWRNRPEKERKPSAENWRFSKQLEVDFKSTHLEKSLEKSIVLATNDDWANQVPVASGLVGPGEGKRAIDLVHLVTDHTFEFIELKVSENSGGPLFAAMEILLYGLLYVFSRQNMENLGYNPDKVLFRANAIELQVLAPAEYYRSDYKLEWLESAICDGLDALSKDIDYRLRFRFRSFPDDFEWRLWSRELLMALEKIEDINNPGG